MILYSVTVNVDEILAQEWLEWMKEIHIPDVLKTGLIKDYRIFRLLSKFEDETGITYSIQYYLDSMADYNLYNSDFAPALQLAHSERYKGHFTSFRSLLEEL